MSTITLLLHENLESARRVVSFVAGKPVTVANESVEVEGLVIVSLAFVARRRAVGRVAASLLNVSRVAASRLNVSRVAASRVAASRLNVSRVAASRLSVSRVAASRRSVSRLSASRLSASRVAVSHHVRLE